MHGHRYRIEATLEGPIKEANEKDSQSGMVLDFGYIKRVLMEEVHDKWDHRFLIAHDDRFMKQQDLVTCLGCIYVDFIPTAENIATDIFKRLAPLFKSKFGEQLTLKRIRVYETPTSYADCCIGG